MAKLITKARNKTIKDKELKWFKNLIYRIVDGKTKIDNVRASYKGKSEWIKVSFWCKVIRKDKEEKENGNDKTAEKTTVKPKD